MEEVIFLFVLALVWIIFASIQDLKKREVANWISFSLIIFALGFRFFYSLFSESFGFFYQGLIGLAIFFILGNLLYYGRMFAGGDAKLMIALGTVLPFSENFFINLKVFFSFIFIFLLIGGIYGLTFSVFLSLRNFNEFKKQFFDRLKKNKRFSYCIMFVGIVLMGVGFLEGLFFVLGIIVFVFPYFYFYAKSVDESCMIKRIKSSELTEGDWLYEDVKINNKIIKKSWEGLNAKDLGLIKKQNKVVLVRQGIPFVPVFLISFLVLLYLWFNGV
ncbi:MAG: prepilin peptidase [archaeon]